MTTAFTRTREQLAIKILRKLRVLGASEPADGEDLAVVAEAMDLRLKELHSLGILWWKVSGATTDLVITGGTVTATVAPTDFLFPVTLSLRVGVDDSPVEIVSHRQYHAVTNKQQAGQPEMAFFDGPTVRFWPVPANNYTGKLTYEAIANDTAISTAPDIRVESMRAFVVLVAADLIDEFAVPEQRANRLLTEAVGAWTTLRTLNSQRAASTPVEMTSF